ncbi:MAG: septum formation family protein, partial [Acidimicrobiales bacterium]
STVPAPTASIGDVPIATLPRPSDLPPLESVDWTAGAVGDCLVQLPDEEALAVVGCAEAHDLQRVAAGSTDDLERLADLDAFDADLVRNAVTDTCAQQFVAFVGNDVLSSELGLVTSQPSEASWADGDRDYACYVGIRDMRVAGDARRSGW